MKPFYERQGITIFHADCRELLATMEAGSVDAVVTDPPYAISIKGCVHRGRPGEGNRNFDFFSGDDDWTAMRRLVCEVCKETLRVISSDGSAYWWCGHRSFGDLTNIFEDSGWQTRFLVWSKLCPAPPPPYTGWPSGAELCLFAYRKARKWRFSPSTTPHSNVFVADGFRHGNPKKLGHPTQKPIEIIEPLIASCTDVGDVILDCFTGSATTLEAAWNLDRRAIGIEISEEYCEIGAKRLDRVISQGRLFKPEPVQETQRELFADAE